MDNMIREFAQTLSFFFRKLNCTYIRKHFAQSLQKLLETPWIPSENTLFVGFRHHFTVITWEELNLCWSVVAFFHGLFNWTSCFISSQLLKLSKQNRVPAVALSPVFLNTYCSSREIFLFAESCSGYTIRIPISIIVLWNSLHSFTQNTDNFSVFELQPFKRSRTRR